MLLLPMAAEAGRRVDVVNLLAHVDDLVGMLHESKDGAALAQACASAWMLRSTCRSEFGDLEIQLKGLVSLTLLRFHFVSCSTTLLWLELFVSLFGAKKSWRNVVISHC
ncbi:hypothetical protein ABZP36_003465 [Zizania latifolia]